jgi:uncharacterized membrane protein HdeD (DUF308 family)
METIFRKWWVILLQGILLIIIGFIFFNNPGEVLTVISLWIGIITLATGIMGLFAYFITKNEGADNNSLWWSIVTLLLGLLMVAKVGLTMKVITVIFGCWVLLTGIFLLSEGWKHRQAGITGWIMVLGGILSVFAGIAIIFDVRTGAVWISTLLGIQALIAGIGFILLAFIKKRLVKEIKAHSFR